MDAVSKMFTAAGLARIWWGSASHANNDTTSHDKILKAAGCKPILVCGDERIYPESAFDAIVEWEKKNSPYLHCSSEGAVVLAIAEARALYACHVADRGGLATLGL